ncbi:putative C6 transcription factor [Mariannaea sp. PMI_226]|nr:putative C6 transcription factor [Mariannaea sp. PMI_226]
MTSFIISSPFEEYLPYLYNSDPLSQDAVSTAIRASSLATFALRVRDSRHMRTARSHYALALARTNASLANPEEALLDSTLAAVLLLGLFEAVIFQGRQSPETWTIHTLGALELLRLRGIDQFQSKLAHRLFTQTITNIRTSCIQRIVPVPPECLALHNQAIRFLDPQDPTLRLGPIIDRAASIRARTKTHPCPQLIYEAIDLDQEALALTDSFEEKMDFGIRLAEDNPPWAYLGIAYRYPNHRVAKYWNAVRMIRMFLNELIWRGISFGFDNPHPNRPVGVGPCDPLCKCTQLEALKQKAIENLGKIAVDVLASVSDFLEPTKGRGKFCPSARALIWPLSILLTSSVYASSVKKHAVFLLHELGVDLNLPQAIDAAKLAYEPEMTEDW